eukprot:7621766-Alexandrium_andersonii.AAC.1
MPADGPEPAERAFRALQRLAEEGVGPRGSTAVVVQARPADHGGNPLPSGGVRYVAAGPAEAGRWLRRGGQ